jgi:hypothetical protein
MIREECENVIGKIEEVAPGVIEIKIMYSERFREGLMPWNLRLALRDLLFNISDVIYRVTEDWR